MARILVTGATGFLGRPLCRQLRILGHQVTELCGEHGDIAAPATLAQVRPVDHVFHLAAKTFVPVSWKDPVEFHRTNVLGSLNVLEYCFKHKAVLTYASAYVYGVATSLPITETLTPRPNNPYALSKYVAEQACEFYSDHRDLDVTVLRPFNIFGPQQSADFLIPEIVRQLKSESIMVRDLTPRRDYVYIDDVVDAFVKTIGRTKGYNVINIGSGHSYSVAEIVARIQCIAGTTLAVSANGEARFNELQDVCADISKARGLLDWRPTITLEEGLRRTMGLAVAESSPHSGCNC